MILSSKILAVQESATLKLNAMVADLNRKGEKIINLTAGEPDFDPPPEAIRAVEEALHKKGTNRYTPVAGLLPLREKIAEVTNQKHPEISKKWGAKNVVVSVGAKHSIFNSLFALLNDGDEVVIPAPYWLSYPEMVQLCGGKSKIVHARFEDDFKITPAQLEKALTSRTKAVILNSPSNPTGATYSKKEFSELGKIISQAKSAAVISDEIYEGIVFDGKPGASFLEANPSLQDRVITVSGLSKKGAMTGWRVGWVVCDETLASAIDKFQGQVTSGINSLTQWASIAVLNLPRQTFEKFRKTYESRRDIAFEILKKSRKIKVRAPEGAFYVFVGIEAALGPGEDSVSFAEELLRVKKVAVVPGTPFGEPHFVRVSIATEETSIQEGLMKLVAFMDEKTRPGPA